MTMQIKILAILLITSAALAQPAFEVASIKTNPGCTEKVPPREIGRLRTECTTAQRLVQMAYTVFSEGVESPQQIAVIGGPDWIQSATYSVEAKANGEPSYPVMMGPMMKSLLADRFRLQTHRETRQETVFLLTSAKNGPKVTESQCVPRDVNRPIPTPAAGQPVPHYCGFVRMRQVTPEKAIFDAFGMSITDLCFFLSQRIGGTVVDQTRLEEKYDFHMEYVRGPSPGPDGADTESFGATLAAVLQQQYGLRLYQGKGPKEYLVIEHIERPTEN